MIDRATELLVRAWQKLDSHQLGSAQTPETELHQEITRYLAEQGVVERLSNGRWALSTRYRAGSTKG